MSEPARGPRGGDRRDHRGGRRPDHGGQGRRGQGRRGDQRSAQRPGERSRGTDPVRRAALDVLRAVADSDSYANLVLPPLLRERRLTGRDAAFATELTYGTLRLRGRYDAILAIAADRDLAGLDAPVLDVLRLGAHQLLGMRVAAHAAVSETVGLARTVCGTGPSQLVNAVLRRVGERDLDTWLGLIGAGAADETDVLARTESHPIWVVRAMRQALARTSDGADDLPALLAADNIAPKVTLVARPGLADLEDIPEDAAPGEFARTAWILPGGDPGTLPALREGRIGVQDEGSQLVALATAAAPIEGSDGRWLDLCAGPGGKAALLGALLADRPDDGGSGRVFVANEVAEHRAALVAQAVAPLQEQLAIEVRVGDGREVGDLEPELYDRVLVDVPCTGLGALRRRPEARWRRSPSDLAGLGPLQRDLLRSAIAAVRPGGVVGFVTCSPHLAETSLVVDDVLKGSADVEVLDAVAVLEQVALSPPPGLTGPYVQLWPHRHGTDAMFLALLRRR